MTVIISGTDGVSDVDGSAGTPALRGTDANTGIFFPAADTIAFAEGGAEAMRIDSSGRMLVGSTTARANLFNATVTSTLQVEGTTSDNSSILIARNSNDATGSVLVTAKSRGTTIGSNTVVQNGDSLAILSFQGSDGTDFVEGARITVAVDGTPGNNDMPGRIVFATTADGASSTTERMRIDSGGGLILVGSTAQKATGTTWSNPSDERLKDNIRDYGKGIAELMQVRVREWEYNGKGGTVEGTKGMGVVADEVMVVLPDTVENYEAKLNADDEEVTAIKKFDATEITWLLVKAVQELSSKNDALESRIAALEAQ